ncbi:MAG: inositol 2-dehydrogenase [Herpetosiphonaceae bacterium]|nr:inositol 2-dehydrogenase [Herpetosiphonaceae bacterium]
MPAESLQIGLIGAGRIGQVHAASLASRIPAARMLMVADVVEDAAQACARQYGIPQAVRDYHALLANPQIEAVVICSATDTHAQIIAEAAQAGKHIFCEKPIALSLGAIDAALQAVEQAGVKLQVGFNRRFDANFRRVRDAVVRGEIGQPELLHIISRDPAPPPLAYIKASGGMFLDMTIHDFDMARFLIGSEVEEVYVAAGVIVDPAIGEAGDVDTAVILLKFANGTIGTIENSRRAVYGYDQRVEILGSAGAIRIDNNHPNTAVISTADSVHHDLPLNFFMTRYTESYVAELAAFVEAVLHDTAVLVSGQDARVPVVMGLAARMSYVEHRPVRVHDIPS